MNNFGSMFFLGKDYFFELKFNCRVQACALATARASLNGSLNGSLAAYSAPAQELLAVASQQLLKPRPLVWVDLPIRGEQVLSSLAQLDAAAAQLYSPST